MKYPRMLHNFVLIRRAEAETKRPSGILLPDSAKEKPQCGKVLSVGPGKITNDGFCHDIAVEAGDTVLFTRYSANEVEINGEELLIVSEDSILAVLQE